MIEDDEEQMKEELKEAFRIYDRDGQGFITTDVSIFTYSAFRTTLSLSLSILNIAAVSKNHYFPPSVIP